MSLFQSKPVKEKIVEGLLDLEGHPDILQSLVDMQNEIGVGFDMKVLAITSIHNDKMAAAFAKAFADVFAHNGSSSLIIDASLYKPSLAGVLGLTGCTHELRVLNDKISVLCSDKEVYPSKLFREKEVQRVIEENKRNFDHIIVLVPAVREHKEIALLKGVIDSAIIVTQRNITQKKDIFDAACFFQAEDLPLSKVVILK